MAQLDLTVSQTVYDTLTTVLGAVRTKLDSLKPVLTRALSQEDGQTKVKALAQTGSGRWFLLILQFRDYLNTYCKDIGWRDD